MMFVTLLLAAGSLALEREENAIARLVRGLVSRTGLLLEKAGLAALCSFAVCLLMLGGLGLFVGLDWSRFPLWLVALAAGTLSFAALGLAIGAITREVRAASLLAFMLALPLAFLALVPSGAVAPALYDLIRVVSARLDASGGGNNASGRWASLMNMVGFATSNGGNGARQGGTVVIGGIFEQNDREDVSKVPFLGDVPYLGNLFKTRTKTSSKTEMLIFLTPKVVTDRTGMR